jgi:DNA (cytosine-5)-methyltransferase 1
MDLFAGCGGMTRGFIDTGRFEPVFAVEFDSDSARTYAMNFGDHVARDAKDPKRPASIEDVNEFPAADVVIGGPPCQGFSPLNRVRELDNRRSLWTHYVRALKQSGADAFVMENVPELLTSPEYSSFLEQVVADFDVQGDILNAADFGVPQMRRRAIVVGLRRGYPAAWPEPEYFSAASGLTPVWRTFRDAVNEPTPLSREPDGVAWHNPRNPRPESIRRYQAVPSNGGNRFQMQENLDRDDLGHLVPRCWRNKPTGTTDVFGRLWWDRPAYTIRTEFYKPEKGRYLHPEEHRPITVREAARCMSFPDDFKLFPLGEQSMTSVARQIGNAVPPLLATAIAKGLVASLDSATNIASLSQGVQLTLEQAEAA